MIQCHIPVSATPRLGFVTSYHPRLRFVTLEQILVVDSYSHIEGRTRESYPNVQDLQSTMTKAGRVLELQILDMRMGFPRPSLNVVIIFSLLSKNVQNRNKTHTKCHFSKLFVLTFCDAYFRNGLVSPSMVGQHFTQHQILWVSLSRE